MRYLVEDSRVRNVPLAMLMAQNLPLETVHLVVDAPYDPKRQVSDYRAAGRDETSIRTCWVKGSTFFPFIDGDEQKD